MSVLIELKRRLANDEVSLSKRLRLTENVVSAGYFPLQSKEEEILRWYFEQFDQLQYSEKEYTQILLSFQNCLKNVTKFEIVSTKTKTELMEILIKILSEGKSSDAVLLQCVNCVCENVSISSYFQQNPVTYIKLLHAYIKKLESTNIDAIKWAMQNMTSFYKGYNRKIYFVNCAFDEGLFKDLIRLSSFNEIYKPVSDAFNLMIFSPSRKMYFSSYLTNAIRGNTIEQNNEIGIVEKTIILPAFDLSKAFVDAYKSDAQLIMLYCMYVFRVVGLKQSLINVRTAVRPHDVEGRSPFGLLLSFVRYLKTFGVDTNVKYTDVLTDGDAKVEVRRSFVSYLQNVSVVILNDDAVIDAEILDIFTALFELDPAILEPKLEVLLPKIMILKKNSDILNSFETLLSKIVEVSFKLSRGLSFIQKWLTPLKTLLETQNDAQFEYKVKEKECLVQGKSASKLRRKILVGDDVFPRPCAVVYGRMYADLLMRQQSELFESMVSDLEENCITLLADGFISPSVIILLEVLSSLLIQVMDNTKMADYGAPPAVADKFWNRFKSCGDDALAKLGRSALQLSYDGRIMKSFLALCHSYGNLMLLNVGYSIYSPWSDLGDYKFGKSESAIYDLSLVHRYMDSNEWNQVVGKIKEETDTECMEILKNLLVQKTLACKIFPFEETKKGKAANHAKRVKLSLLNDSDNVLTMCCNDFDLSAILCELDEDANKAADAIIDQILTSPDDSTTFFEKEAIKSNNPLLRAILVRCLKELWVVFGGTYEGSLVGDATQLYERFSKVEISKKNRLKAAKVVNVVRSLKVANLPDEYQLPTLFALFVLKKILVNDDNNIIVSVNSAILGIFELSYRLPELFKIFNIEYLLAFGPGSFLESVTADMPDKIIEFILKSAIKGIKVNDAPLRLSVKILVKTPTSTRNPNPLTVTCILATLISKEKKQAGNSEQRTILSECEEKLHKELMKRLEHVGNVFKDGASVSFSIVEAYSILLVKYGERKIDEHKEIFAKLVGNLPYFVDLAVKSLLETEPQPQNVMPSLHLISAIFKNRHNLTDHSVFEKSSAFLADVWSIVKHQLGLAYGVLKQESTRGELLDQLAVIAKQLFDQTDVGHFNGPVVKDISELSVLKKPSTMLESSEATLKNILVAKFLYSNLLKCVLKLGKMPTFVKTVGKFCRDLNGWLRTHIFIEEARWTNENAVPEDEDDDDRITGSDSRIIDGALLDVISECLAVLIEVVSARKFELHPLTMDSVFGAAQSLECILNPKKNQSSIRIEDYFKVHERVTDLLNAMLLNRSELLEDRWPSFLQIYRMLVQSVCLRCNSKETSEEDEVRSLSRLALNLEKITTTMAKRKYQLSRLSAYLIADFATSLEKSPPPLPVRQHLENCAIALMQNSDNSYTMSFLNRVLAGSHGHIALNNMYTAYKKYHKYTGAS